MRAAHRRRQEDHRPVGAQRWTRTHATRSSARPSERAKLLEEDFAAQLEGTFDVRRDGDDCREGRGHLVGPPGVPAREDRRRHRTQARRGHDAPRGGRGLPPRRRVHDPQPLRRAQDARGARAGAGVHHEGEQSAATASSAAWPRPPLLPDSAGYRLYLESLFDELSTEVKVLFDRRDPRPCSGRSAQTFEQLLEILNAPELAGVWGEDETIGWVYQYFNSDDERKKMRDESQAPRNSRELAVRNQFFTPRYVVQFLVDNTLGRIWYEMRGAKTALAERCEYLVRARRGARTAREEGSARPADPRPRLRLRPLPALRVRSAARDLRGGMGRPRVPPRARRRDGRCARTTRPRRASAGRSRPDPRAQPLRRRHRPALRADRCAGALAARAAGVATTSASPRASGRAIRRTHIVVAEPMPGDADAGRRVRRRARAAAAARPVHEDGRRDASRRRARHAAARRGRHRRRN